MNPMQRDQSSLLIRKTNPPKLLPPGPGKSCELNSLVSCYFVIQSCAYLPLLIAARLRRCFFFFFAKVHVWVNVLYFKTLSEIPSHDNGDSWVTNITDWKKKKVLKKPCS